MIMSWYGVVSFWKDGKGGSERTEVGSMVDHYPGDRFPSVRCWQGGSTRGTASYIGQKESE